jgi:hypothetical protein
MGGFIGDLDLASGVSPEVDGLNKEPTVALTAPIEREPQAKASKRSLS